MNGEASLLLVGGLISLTANTISCWGKRRVDVGESVKTEKGTNEKLDYLTKANTYVKDCIMKN